MKKIAIIGASELQLPLIEKAKEMGLETHVFAWAAGDVGETAADHFYPISIVEKDQICEECRKIGVDGICTIASDLAAVAVNYVADKLGLTGNTLECTLVSTNKYRMRKTFEKCGDPTPKEVLLRSEDDFEKAKELAFPVVIKPLDRSGSRGITKIDTFEELPAAFENACSQGFIKEAIVEEFIEGREFSVECISWEGEHSLLNVTQKYTTSAPHFIEKAHLEPAQITVAEREDIREKVFHALNSLGIRYGASHSELKIRPDGSVCFVEIGGRMGGDFIGSDLVRLSTGYDFTKAVVETALGIKPSMGDAKTRKAAGVRYILDPEDLKAYEKINSEHPEYIVGKKIPSPEKLDLTVSDSSERFGYYLMQADKAEDLIPYLP